MQRFTRWQDELKTIMEPADETQKAQSIDVGGRLRELRKTQGLSLRALAGISGLNFNTLSLIENGRSSPSVSTLQQLAHALQVPITAFFNTPTVQQEVVVQRPGKRPRAPFFRGMLEDLGGGLNLGEGVPLLLTLEPGAVSGQDSIVHSGQEFVYCLEGQLTYEIADQEHTLDQGDSLIFQAHLPHRWGNRGTLTSRSILILCPSDEYDRSAKQHFNHGRADQE